MIRVTRIILLSFGETREYIFPVHLQPSPGLLVLICTPRTMPCSKKREDEPLDYPLNSLAC